MSGRGERAAPIARVVLLALLLGAAVGPTSPLASVENRTARDLWLRPERTVEPVALAPSLRFSGFDAIADPVAHPGMIFRACDFCSVIVAEDGRVKVLCSGLAACACQLVRGGWKDHGWQRRQQTAYYDHDWDPLFARAGAVTSLRAR